MSQSGSYRTQSFSTRHDRDTLEYIAENRDFDEVSAYLRYLIRQDIQEQISEGKLDLVPTNE